MESLRLRWKGVNLPKIYGKQFGEKNSIYCISLPGLPKQSPTDWVVKTTKMYFLRVLEAGGPIARRRQGWFLPRPLSPWRPMAALLPPLPVMLPPCAHVSRAFFFV